jgi:hypothetical protein
MRILISYSEALGDRKLMILFRPNRKKEEINFSRKIIALLITTLETQSLNQV